MSRSKVTDVEVSAFSECFLFLVCLFFGSIEVWINTLQDSVFSCTCTHLNLIFLIWISLSTSPFYLWGIYFLLLWPFCYFIFLYPLFRSRSPFTLQQSTVPFCGSTICRFKQVYFSCILMHYHTSSLATGSTIFWRMRCDYKFEQCNLCTCIH